MPAERNRPKRENFNSQAHLPFQLRLEDFEIAMQDVYDLFYDVNTVLNSSSGMASLEFDSSHGYDRRPVDGPPKLQSARRWAKVKPFVLHLLGVGWLSVASKELPDQCKGFRWSRL